MYEAPPHAEEHLVSDYTRCVYINSKLIPGKKMHKSVFSCPRCKIDTDYPEHGKNGGCKSCGLNWVSYGNGLYLWDEEE